MNEDRLERQAATQRNAETCRQYAIESRIEAQMRANERTLAANESILEEHGMLEYQYRYMTSTNPTEWRNCDRERALSILAKGYFDPQIALDYMHETGDPVRTSFAEVRKRPEHEMALTHRPKLNRTSDADLIFP